MRWLTPNEGDERVVCRFLLCPLELPCWTPEKGYHDKQVRWLEWACIKQEYVTSSEYNEWFSKAFVSEPVPIQNPHL